MIRSIEIYRKIVKTIPNFYHLLILIAKINNNSISILLLNRSNYKKKLVFSLKLHKQKRNHIK
jgi:hypothetical protein